MSDAAHQHPEPHAFQRDDAAHDFQLLGLAGSGPPHQQADGGALLPADEVYNLKEFHPLGAYAVNLQDNVEGAQPGLIGRRVRYGGDDGNQPVADAYLGPDTLEITLYVLPRHGILAGVQVGSVWVVSGLQHPADGPLGGGLRVQGSGVNMLLLQQRPDLGQLGEFRRQPLNGLCFRIFIAKGGAANSQRRPGRQGQQQHQEQGPQG